MITVYREQSQLVACSRLQEDFEQWLNVCRVTTVLIKIHSEHINTKVMCNFLWKLSMSIKNWHFISLGPNTNGTQWRIHFTKLTVNCQSNVPGTLHTCIIHCALEIFILSTRKPKPGVIQNFSCKLATYGSDCQLFYFCGY